MGDLHRPERRALGVGGHLSQRRMQIVCTTVASAGRLRERRRKQPPSFVSATTLFQPLYTAATVFEMTSSDRSLGAVCKLVRTTLSSKGARPDQRDRVCTGERKPIRARGLQ